MVAAGSKTHGSSEAALSLVKDAADDPHPAEEVSAKPT